MNKTIEYKKKGVPRTKKILSKIAIYFLVILVLLIFFIPIYWILTTSLKSSADVFQYSWFFKPTISNYKEVLNKGNFKHCYMNSSLIAILSTLLSIIIGFPTAYALSRFNIKGKDNLAFWILSLRMIPPIVVALPFFIIYIKLGLYDSLMGMILVYVAFNLPFVIWMLRGFIEEIPKEIEEAALVDGCSHKDIIFRVTLPLSMTGISATATLCFIFIWNEFLFALTLTGVGRRTVTVAVYNFIGFTEILWGQMSAASLLVSIPIIIFGILVRKYLVSGLTLGAIKE